MIFVTLWTYPKIPQLSIVDTTPELKMLSNASSATPGGGPKAAAGGGGTMSLEGTTYFNMTNPNFFQM